MHRTFSIVLAAFLLMAFAFPSQAQKAIHFSKPLADGKVTITVSNNGVTDTTEVPVKKTDEAKDKRNKVVKALKAKGYDAKPSGGAGGGPAVVLGSLAKGTNIDVNTGQTGEAHDKQKTEKADKGAIEFDGAFLNFDLDTGGAAAFTAGIVTTLGEAEVTYRAEDFAEGELIEGAYVAQRLYLSLVDAASDLGAVLELGESSIEVFFDPATAETAGVIFGTTSPSGGCTGSLIDQEGDDEEPLPTEG